MVVAAIAVTALSWVLRLHLQQVGGSEIAHLRLKLVVDGAPARVLARVCANVPDSEEECHTKASEEGTRYGCLQEPLAAKAALARAHSVRWLWWLIHIQEPHLLFAQRGRGAQHCWAAKAEFLLWDRRSAVEP